jgi:hypothetical protein
VKTGILNSQSGIINLKGVYYNDEATKVELGNRIRRIKQEYEDIQKRYAIAEAHVPYQSPEKDKTIIQIPPPKGAINGPASGENSTSTTPTSKDSKDSGLGKTPPSTGKLSGRKTIDAELLNELETDDTSESIQDSPSASDHPLDHRSPGVREKKRTP